MCFSVLKIDLLSLGLILHWPNMPSGHVIQGTSNRELELTVTGRNCRKLERSQETP